MLYAIFLLCLLMHPEDRGDIIIWNVSRLSVDTWCYMSEDGTSVTSYENIQFHCLTIVQIVFKHGGTLIQSLVNCPDTCSSGT
jgi:hypothetical protein